MNIKKEKMRSIILIMISALLAGCVSESNKYSFPRSQAEDSKGYMSEQYWTYWSPEVQARINADIEKNRKAEAMFVIDDIAPNTKVVVEQISSDFGFGASSFNWDQLGKKEYNDIYKNLFGTLFNRATVGFYWKEMELEQGKRRYFAEERDSEEWWQNCDDTHSQPHWRRPPTEPIIKWCEEHNVAIHGHPLVWGHTTAQEPNWLRDGIPAHEKAALDTLDKFRVDRKDGRNCATYERLSGDEIATIVPKYTKLLEKRVFGNVEDIMKRYDGRIHSWDVVNESYTDDLGKTLIPGSKLTKSVRYGLMPGDYVYRSFDMVSNLNNGNALLNINESQSDSKYEVADAYSAQIKNLLKRGAKVDVIGIQMHLMRKHRNAELVSQGADLWTPKRAYYILDKLAENNLPMCMSEISISAAGSDYRSEMVQSIVAVNLYRLWFSYPNMTAITWWNLVDDCGYRGQPANTGLFTRDMKPKLVFYALYNLIHKEWRTNTTLTPDSDGRIAWCGFTGKYRITWTDTKNEKREAIYELKK